MGGISIGLYVTRALQLVFAIIVLGVAVSIVDDASDASKYCRELYSKDVCDYLKPHFTALDTALEYAAFTGAFGILGALVGIVAAFLTAIPWFVAFGFDALATIFFLAGGINSAVRRSQFDDAVDDDGDKGFFTRFDTTAAFMFLGFLASLIAMVLVFLRNRSGKTHSSAV